MAEENRALTTIEPKALEPARPEKTEPAKPAEPNPGPAPGPTHEKDKPPEAGPENPAPARPRRRVWWWVVAGILALGGIFLFYRSCGSASTTAAKGGTTAGTNGRGGAQAPAAITTGQTKTGNISIFVNALGTVTPVYTVTLYSQITGQVLDVHYREGQMVKRGDPLIDVDPRPYQTTLTQAEGALERDQGLLAEAEMDLKRYQAAAARNAVPRQQLEDQEKIVQQERGTVKADQGAVDYDRVQLSYCHIVSPITGRVGLRLVDPGNTVFAGNSSTLAVITQLQPITIVFNVSEDELNEVQSQLRGGRALQVQAYDRSNENQIETGRLTSLDNEVDTTTGTIKFRAEFPNRNLALFPNQFVNARLLVKTLRNVVLVPSAAIQHNGTAAFVYLVKPDNTVAVQNVTVLTSNDDETAVTGLDAGSTVATTGFDRLENNVSVSVNNNAPGQRIGPNAGNAPLQSGGPDQNRTPGQANAPASAAGQQTNRKK